MKSGLVKEIFMMALDSIRMNKLRSFLTILGIVIGVLTIVAMVAVIEGINASFAQQLEAMGANVLIVSRHEPGIHFGRMPEEMRRRKKLGFCRRRRPGALLPDGGRRDAPGGVFPLPAAGAGQIPGQRDRQPPGHRRQPQVPADLRGIHGGNRPLLYRGREPEQARGVRHRRRDRRRPVSQRQPPEQACSRSKAEN